MEFIGFRTLLSEMREAEQKYVETHACHLDPISQGKAERGRERLRIFDQLVRETRPDAQFPNDPKAERFLVVMIGLVARKLRTKKDVISAGS